MAKADNLLAILWLLRSRRRMTAEQLAQNLEISVRTVYRYIDSLCASGVPIIADLGPDGGYRLAENFRAAPLFFEPTELKAIFHAAQFTREAGYPYSEALETATAKVRQNLTPEQAAYLSRHTAAFQAVRAPRGGPVEPWLGLLETAVADTVTVRIRYQKPGQSEGEERLLDPLGVAYFVGLWHLFAYCHQREAVRQFRIDRIRSLEPTGQKFRRPPDFRLEEHFSDDWLHARVNTGPFTEVLLEGEPSALAALADHWYLRHCPQEQVGATLRLRMDPYGLSHLPPTLLQQGAAVRILAPDHLREEVIDLATRWIEHHRSGAQNA